MKEISRVDSTDKEIGVQKKNSKKNWLFFTAVAGIIFLALAVLPVRYDRIITYVGTRNSANEISGSSLAEIQVRYDQYISDVNRDWLVKMTKMESRVQEITRLRVGQMYSRWTSTKRIDEFVDEYYGYFKGFKLLYLSVKDFVKRDSDKEATRREVSKMINSNLIFDFATDMDSLFVELEGYIADNTGQFMEKLLLDLDKIFSEEDLKRLGKGFQVGSIKITSSELQSIIRFGGDFIITPKIISTIFNRIAPEVTSRAVAGSGNRLFAQIGSKVASAITSTILGKIIAGLGIGIIVDYLLVKINKLAGQEDLKDSLVSAMQGFRSSVISDINRRFGYAFEDLAEQRLVY